MFQVIDLRPRGPGLGQTILQFFLAREQLQLQQENQKLQKDRLKTEQERAEFDQQRALAEAAGKALGLGAGRAEEAQQAVGQGFDQIAQFPDVAGLGLAQIGQAGQAAVQAQPPAGQAIQRLESPFARATAAEALAGERQRAFGRQEARAERAFEVAQFKETRRFNNARLKMIEDQNAFDRDIAERRLALAEATNEREIKEAERGMNLLAVDLAKQAREEFRENLQLMGDPRAASQLAYGTAKPPGQSELVQQKLDLLRRLDSTSASVVLGPPAPSEVGAALGVDLAVVQAYEELQGRAELDTISNEDFLASLLALIEQTDADQDYKETQRGLVTIWLRKVLNDSELGKALEQPTAAGPSALGLALRRAKTFLKQHFAEPATSIRIPAE